MRTIVHTLFVLGLVATAPAQVVPTATAGGITVRADSLQAAPVAPGSDVWSGLSRSCVGLVGTAQFTATHQVSTSEVALQWSLACQANQPGSVASEATVRYELWAATPVVGQLVVAWTPTSTGSGVVTLGVDLQDDGSLDGTGAVSWPVALGPGGLPFRVHAICSATAGITYGPFGSNWSYHGRAQGTLSVRFVPTPCATQTVGLACGTPQLEAVANLQPGVTLAGEFDGAAEIGILVLGVTGAALPLPGPSACSVLVAPLATDWQLVDAQHRVGWALAVPTAVRPLTWRAQLLGLDVGTFSVATSRALQITSQ